MGWDIRALHSMKIPGHLCSMGFKTSIFTFNKECHSTSISAYNDVLLLAGSICVYAYFF